MAQVSGADEFMKAAQGKPRPGGLPAGCADALHVVQARVGGGIPEAHPPHGFTYGHGPGLAHVELDADLSALCGVETRALVQAVKRNIDRFLETSCSRTVDKL
jgi:hypothetical protein